MSNIEFHIGDRVIVSAAVTGTGENMPGWITSIEKVCGQTLVPISYERPSSIGDLGACVSNLGLITRVEMKEETKET